MIGEEDIRVRDFVGSECRREGFKGPKVVFKVFFSKEAESCRESLVVTTDTGNVEKGHVVLVCLVSAI
jgi:hypothetical protein